MKKFFFSAVAALMALTASAATTITVADYAATNFITTDNHFSIAAEKAASSSNPPAYNETSKDLRIYAGGTLTITAGSPMQSISFELSAKGKARLSADNTVDCGTLVCDTTGGVVKVKWTGDSKKVVLTVGEKATLGTDGAGASAQFDFIALTIEGGTEGTVEGAPLYSINFTTDSLGWTIENKVMPDSLSYVWKRDTLYGFKASAYYNKTNYATESWLISPVIDLKAANIEHAKMQFTHARKFGEQSQLSVKVTKDGTNWNTITVPNWPDGSSWNFFESGEIDLTNYISDKTQIAFVYTSSNSAAATWEIKTIEIKEGILEEVVHIANTPETAYTVTEAIALIDAGKSLHETVYVVGKIDSISAWTEKQDKYKNINFYISDDKNQMYVYGCFGLNKDSIRSEAEMNELIKPGDVVIICGTMSLFNSTYEMNQGSYIYSVTKAEGIDEATIENEKAEKFFRNGVLYIRRNGVEYTVMGAKAE